MPLLRASDRDRHLTKIDAEDSPGRSEMSLAKAEDRELVDRLIAQVTEWLQVLVLQLLPASLTLCQLLCNTEAQTGSEHRRVCQASPWQKGRDDASELLQQPPKSLDGFETESVVFKAGQ